MQWQESQHCPAPQVSAVRVVSAPVPLFYRRSLMRAFNFSFTSSVTPTFNNTPCARQKFAPGNHGFDHKTTAGRRSWLTLSVLQAVWSLALLEIRWSSDRGLWSPTGTFFVPPPSLSPVSPRLWGRRFQAVGRLPVCRQSHTVEGNPGVPHSLLSLPHNRPTVCGSLTLPAPHFLPGGASQGCCA